MEYAEKKDFAKTIPLHKAGNSDKCLDVVIVPAGYTEAEKDKMYADLDLYAGYFFSKPPFSNAKDKMNIIGIERFDRQSGIPGLENSTADYNDLGVHYNTFGSERYLMTEQLWNLHDALLGASYDQIVILCNSDVYGGGGIYNFYATTYVNHENGFVLIHEFGHSFAGLADEYAYDFEEIPMYPHDVEPWEPNITTLVNFSSKWKDMVKKGTPIPTPLSENTKVAESKVGVFEGAGYSTKGVYRGVQDCRMRINDTPEFCPVCKRAITNLIDFYTK